MLPDPLAEYRNPRSKAAAENGAFALIQYLKAQAEQPTLRIRSVAITVGEWLQRFISLDNNPRSARLISKNRPYSPKTLATYANYFQNHIAEDPLVTEKMAVVEQADILAFMGRLAGHTLKGGGTMSGTRSFEIVYKFIRMAFREYQRHHPRWVDPFLSIETPKPTESHRPDALSEDEVIRLFRPGVLKDVMQHAVCAAMFWAGLRRSELWALRPEDLDWKTPKITVCHAWKNFDRKFRELGDPKHHKKRIAPFPDVLQQAIRDLWKTNGKHEFVFSKKDGMVPGPSWIRYHLPRWLVRAGIEADGRKITPHSSRHSLASALEAQGVPLRYIQDMLGHSDLKTTVGYLHAPQGTINRIARKIGEIQHQLLESNEQDTG